MAITIESPFMVITHQIGIQLLFGGQTVSAD